MRKNMTPADDLEDIKQLSGLIDEKIHEILDEQEEHIAMSAFLSSVAHILINQGEDIETILRYLDALISTVKETINHPKNQEFFF